MPSTDTCSLIPWKIFANFFHRLLRTALDPIAKKNVKARERSFVCLFLFRSTVKT